MKKVLFVSILMQLYLIGFSQPPIFESKGFNLEYSFVNIESYDGFALYKSFELKNLSGFDSIAFKKRKPGIAFLWSLIIPGAGQFYNKQTFKGILAFSVTATGIVYLLRGGDGPPPGLGTSAADEKNNQFPIGAVFVITSSLFSTIDAVISAKRINKRNNYTLKVIQDIKIRNNYLTNKFEFFFGPKITLSF